jgi:hypothetical protein
VTAARCGKSLAEALDGELDTHEAWCYNSGNLAPGSFVTVEDDAIEAGRKCK